MIEKIKSAFLNMLIKSFSFASQLIIFILAFNIIILLFSFILTVLVIYILVNYLNKTNKESNVSFTRTSRKKDQDF